MGKLLANSKAECGLLLAASRFWLFEATAAQLGGAYGSIEPNKKG